MPLTKIPSVSGVLWPRRIGVEDIACVCLLAYFAMQGAIPGIAPNQANEMTHTAATRLMKTAGIGSQILMNSAICFLILFHARRLLRFAFALQWTALVAIFAICSTLWSQNPMTTARRSVPFALATLFGLYMASRFQVRQQLRILTGTMVILAAASIVFVLFFPSIGLEASTGHAGNWQGVFTQKNACGRAMVFATAALLSLRGSEFIRLLCFLLFACVLAMSGSRGAWMIEGMLLGCYGLLRLAEHLKPKGRTLLLFSFMLAVVMATVGAWFYFPEIAGLLNRDATLTGRTEIWRQVWAAVMKHPLLGYGFAAFWQGMKGESYNVILALRFVVFHAHNGLLEIWLELGAAGLGLIAMSYLRAWRKLWPVLLSSKNREAYWMIFMLLLIALYDMDESTLLSFNGLFWILYVAAVADIEIMSVERRACQRNACLNESNCVHVQAMV
jgi:O-antigen ligase